MRSIRFVIVSVTICFLVAQGALAAANAQPAKQDHENLPHTAIYKIPDLTKELSKALVKSLGKMDGIISAKPDLKAGTFSVTFSPQEIDGKKLEAAIIEIEPKASLDSIGPADSKSPSSACSKCPKHKDCAKKKG